MWFCSSTPGYVDDVSPSTVLGIVLVAVSAVAIAIVAAMFLWGAREDGRDQRRRNARLRR